MSYLQTIKTTSGLLTQPYPLVDFGGGWTDNFIQGGPSRFLLADNFYVTVDRKLQTRYGSVLLDSVNYALPSLGQRVGALINYDNYSYIMAQSSEFLYVLNTTWQAITGPTGNPALAPCAAQNTVSWAEWQHQLYLVNDSATANVSKVYLDQNNVFQTRTAGLPAFIPNPNYVPGALLTACIALANQIQTQFTAHMNDSGAVLNSQLHQAVDTADIALLAISPSSDQPSLSTLCTALSQAYAAHIADANLTTTRVYHWAYSNFNSPATMNLSLVSPLPAGVYTTTYNAAIAAGDTVTAATAAALQAQLAASAQFLDDLKQKYYWHAWALNTHANPGTLNLLNQHAVAIPHIGYSSSGIVVTPNITDALICVNSLAVNLAFHLTSAYGSSDGHSEHTVADTNAGILPVPTAVDYDTYVIACLYTRAKYFVHFEDAEEIFSPCTFSSTNTSATIAITQFSTQAYIRLIDTGSFVLGPQLFSTPTGGTTLGAPGAVTAASTQTTESGLTTLSSYHYNSPTNVLAQTISGTVFSPIGFDLASWTAILADTYTKFNLHEKDSQAHHTGGNYQVIVPIPYVSQVNYAFHYFYSYTASGVVYNVVGPVTLIGPIETCASVPPGQLYPVFSGTPSYLVLATTSTQITGLPTLINGAGTNYDTTAIQINLYRTINGGTTYFTLGQVANGTSNFTDDFSDVYPVTPGALPLYLQPTLYTTGGVVNFDPAPMCKFIHMLNNTAYYGAVWDSGQFLPRRVRQSIQGNPDSSPRSFYDDLDDDLMGISSSRNNLIYHCKNSTYLGAGGFNSQASGTMTHQKISDTVGCISTASIVMTEIGVFFAGPDGFYYTDGYQLVKLSAELNNSYQIRTQTAQQRRNIYGCYDKWNRRIWWSMQPNPSDWDVSESWIFYLDYGVTGPGVFNSASNFDYWRPSAMLFYNNTQYRGDARGWIFKHGPQYMSDPACNLTVAATSWDSTYLPYNYSSCAIDFGSTFNRKWVPRVTVNGKNVGNVSIGITSINDTGKTNFLLAPIWYNINDWWGDPTDVWGDNTKTWGATQQLDSWRRFHSGEQRCDLKQIVLKPITIGVYRYEDFPGGSYATVSNAGTATLTVPAGYTGMVWPNDVLNYVIAFSNDGYVATYPITGGQGTTVLTLSGTVPNLSAQSWVIRGIPKDGALSITAINLHYALMGKEQQAYQGPASAGENS